MENHHGLIRCFITLLLIFVVACSGSSQEREEPVKIAIDTTTIDFTDDQKKPLPAWEGQISSPFIRQLSALQYVPTNMALEEMPPCFSDAELPDFEEGVGPFTHGISDQDFKKLSVATFQEFYVDARSSNGDGSKSAPFSTIAEAVKASGEERAYIFVAGGDYQESFAIGSNISLLGGFNSNWVRDISASPSVIRATRGSLTVKKKFNGQKTIVDGFTIYGGSEANAPLYAQPGAHVALKNNTIYINMAVVDWPTYGDTHHGTALEGMDAFIEVYQNRFLVPSETPQHVISRGIILSGGCHLIAANHFISFRTSVITSQTEGELFANMFEDGFNGVTSRGENITVRENVIALQEAAIGCGYAIYLGGLSEDGVDIATQPKIVSNKIVLEGPQARGINETHLQSDPLELVDNAFVLLGGSTMLYGDVDSNNPGSHRVNRMILDIAEVNSLPDIPRVSGNVVR